MKNRFIYSFLFMGLLFSQPSDKSTYIVKEGQTITDIAEELRLDANDLVDWNNLTDFNLYTGQEIITSEDVSTSLIDKSLVLKNLEKAESIEDEKENSSYLDSDFIEEDLSKEEELISSKTDFEIGQEKDEEKNEVPELAKTGELTTKQYIITFIFLLIAWGLDEAGVIDLGLE